MGSEEKIKFKLYSEDKNSHDGCVERMCKSRRGE